MCSACLSPQLFMKPQKPYLQEKHIENVNRKYQTLKGKEALLATWEDLEEKNGYDADAHATVLELRAKIRNIKAQLQQMDHTQDFS